MAVVRPLELKHRSLVTSYLRRYPPTTSELTFANLFVWRNSRPIRFGELDGSLVFIVESHEGGETRRVVFGSPVGEASPADVLDSLGVEVEGFVRIPKETAAALQHRGLKVEDDRNNWDYVHRLEDLASLRGRRFHKKRNLVRQCLDAYACQYEPIESSLLAECLDMQDRWCRARGCGLDPGLCSEYLGIRETFVHYEELQLVGGAIRIDGRVEAYAIGEELSPGTAVCHFEKAMPGMKGLGQLVNQWFATYSLGGFEFVNREQDLGIPGLRQAKESYFPHHMVEKFTAGFDSAIALPHVVEPHECDKHIQP
jgi:hypothetical protein